MKSEKVIRIPKKAFFLGAAVSHRYFFFTRHVDFQCDVGRGDGHVPHRGAVQVDLGRVREENIDACVRSHVRPFLIDALRWQF